MSYSKVLSQESTCTGKVSLRSLPSRAYHFDSRDDVKPLVNRVPGNVHQGFESRYQAERAYILAFAMGCVRVLPARGAPVVGLPPAAAPTPAAIMDVFASVAGDFLGAEWHVVFKGKRPGIYPAWYVCFIQSKFPTNIYFATQRNFAASQTSGVSLSLYQKYPTRRDAQAAFDDATANGRTAIL